MSVVVPRTSRPLHAQELARRYGEGHVRQRPHRGDGLAGEAIARTALRTQSTGPCISRLVPRRETSTPG